MVEKQKGFISTIKYSLVVHARRNEKKSGETRGLSRNVAQLG